LPSHLDGRVMDYVKNIEDLFELLGHEEEILVCLKGLRFISDD